MTQKRQPDDTKTGPDKKTKTKTNKNDIRPRSGISPNSVAETAKGAHNYHMFLYELSQMGIGTPEGTEKVSFTHGSQSGFYIIRPTPKVTTDSSCPLAQVCRDSPEISNKDQEAQRQVHRHSLCQQRYRMAAENTKEQMDKNTDRFPLPSFPT